ncbi:sensor histidine kinase [Winogradskyella flava]|uniref:Sensor histidine kinase n=1 Tax=Winogradskyella flava TaxID=1884876 RepID=A0A842ISV0_9FLAO|nr:sensor histidine kinase [Winogradskyella flava]MBC2845229.1 sensor histidine kinase [Winogradskyella flava]
MKNTKKYIYLVVFIITVVTIGFGLIVLSPQVISILLSIGYILFFTATKTTNYFSKDLFIIRYEKAFFLLIVLIVAIIQVTINDAMRSVPLILMCVLFLVICYLIFSWVYEKIKIIRELKNEKLHSELSFLRSQINPHFFFNTLNNLYGLAIEKSEETPKTILKLSEMMRYTIYDGKKEKVAIEKEIDFLKNYIDLHTIRHFDKLDVTFDIDTNEPNLKIAPLLLINLLENAFKHGAEKLDKDAFIHLNISTHTNIINFTIENNFEDEQDSNGIGLENLKRRLQLLYPNAHDFSTSTHNSVFRAELSLYLNQ